MKETVAEGKQEGGQDQTLPEVVQDELKAIANTRNEIDAEQKNLLDIKNSIQTHASKGKSYGPMWEKSMAQIMGVIEMRFCSMEHTHTLMSNREAELSGEIE